jgi:hypothetical protein
MNFDISSCGFLYQLFSCGRLIGWFERVDESFRRRPATKAFCNISSSVNPVVHREPRWW